ncbi:MAG: hypothetical protein IPP35_09560 [Elusimicrobia bacterium]|nr:hypothetical protein [Elusimicrobiota bacterium]
MTATYFLAQVAGAYTLEGNLWAQRRAARQDTRQGDPDTRAGESQISPTAIDLNRGPSPWQDFKSKTPPADLAGVVLPFGTIREVVPGRAGAPVVVHLQDVHGDETAQRNIAGLVSALAARGAVLVGVEGATGPLDLAPLRDFPDPRATALLADYFLKMGILSGPEAAGLTAEPVPALFGVEDPALYQAHLAAAQACLSRRKETRRWIAGLRSLLERVKGQVYPAPLADLDRRRMAFEDNQGTLGDYAGYLTGLAHGRMAVGENLRRFTALRARERQLDVARVEEERTRLLGELARRLDETGLRRLTRAGLDYRLGRRSFGDFHRELAELCSREGLRRADYPAVENHARYLGDVEKIQRARLFGELRELEDRVARSLAGDETMRVLWGLSRDADRLTALLENKMAPEDWADYQGRREDILALPARLQALVPGETAPVLPDLAAHETFCLRAVERNDALADRLAEQIRKAGGGTAVLVAGGFHTPGMVETLRRKGFTSVVVTPRLGDALPGNPLDVFARDPIPLERFLAGRQINLSPERVLWGGKRETERAAVTAILAAGRAPLAAAIRQAEGKPAVAGRPLGGWTVAFEPSATYDAMVRADGPKSWRVGASRAGGPSGAVRHAVSTGDRLVQSVEVEGYRLDFFSRSSGPLARPREILRAVGSKLSVALRRWASGAARAAHLAARPLPVFVGGAARWIADDSGNGPGLFWLGKVPFILQPPLHLDIIPQSPGWTSTPRSEPDIPELERDLGATPAAHRRAFVEALAPALAVNPAAPEESVVDVRRSFNEFNRGGFEFQALRGGRILFTVQGDPWIFKTSLFDGQTQRAHLDWMPGLGPLVYFENRATGKTVAFSLERFRGGPSRKTSSGRGVGDFDSLEEAVRETPRRLALAFLVEETAPGGAKDVAARVATFNAMDLRVPVPESERPGWSIFNPRTERTLRVNDLPSGANAVSVVQRDGDLAIRFRSVEGPPRVSEFSVERFRRSTARIFQVDSKPRSPDRLDPEREKMSARTALAELTGEALRASWAGEEPPTLQALREAFNRRGITLTVGEGERLSFALPRDGSPRMAVLNGLRPRGVYRTAAHWVEGRGLLILLTRIPQLGAKTGTDKGFWEGKTADFTVESPFRGSPSFGIQHSAPNPDPLGESALPATDGETDAFALGGLRRTAKDGCFSRLGRFTSKKEALWAAALEPAGLLREAYLLRGSEPGSAWDRFQERLRAFNAEDRVWWGNRTLWVEDSFSGDRRGFRFRASGIGALPVRMALRFVRGIGGRVVLNHGAAGQGIRSHYWGMVFGPRPETTEIKRGDFRAYRTFLAEGRAAVLAAATRPERPGEAAFRTVLASLLLPGASLKSPTSYFAAVLERAVDSLQANQADRERVRTARGSQERRELSQEILARLAAAQAFFSDTLEWHSTLAALEHDENGATWSLLAGSTEGAEAKLLKELVDLQRTVNTQLRGSRSVTLRPRCDLFFGRLMEIRRLGWVSPRIGRLLPWGGARVDLLSALALVALGALLLSAVGPAALIEVGGPEGVLSQAIFLFGLGITALGEVSPAESLRPRAALAARLRPLARTAVDTPVNEDIAVRVRDGELSPIPPTSSGLIKMAIGPVSVRFKAQELGDKPLSPSLDWVEGFGAVVHWTRPDGRTLSFSMARYREREANGNLYSTLVGVFDSLELARTEVRGRLELARLVEDLGALDHLSDDPAWARKVEDFNRRGIVLPVPEADRAALSGDPENGDQPRAPKFRAGWTILNPRTGRSLRLVGLPPGPCRVTAVSSRSLGLALRFQSVQRPEEAPAEFTLEAYRTSDKPMVSIERRFRTHAGNALRWHEQRDIERRLTDLLWDYVGTDPNAPEPDGLSRRRAALNRENIPLNSYEARLLEMVGSRERKQLHIIVFGLSTEPIWVPRVEWIPGRGPLVGFVAPSGEARVFGLGSLLLHRARVKKAALTFAGTFWSMAEAVERSSFKPIGLWREARRAWDSGIPGDIERAKKRVDMFNADPPPLSDGLGGGIRIIDPFSGDIRRLRLRGAAGASWHVRIDWATGEPPKLLLSRMDTLGELDLTYADGFFLPVPQDVWIEPDVAFHRKGPNESAFQSKAGPPTNGVAPVPGRSGFGAPPKGEGSLDQAALFRERGELRGISRDIADATRVEMERIFGDGRLAAILDRAIDALNANRLEREGLSLGSDVGPAQRREIGFRVMARSASVHALFGTPLEWTNAVASLRRATENGASWMEAMSLRDSDGQVSRRLVLQRPAASAGGPAIGLARRTLSDRLRDLWAAGWLRFPAHNSLLAAGLVPLSPEPLVGWPVAVLLLATVFLARFLTRWSGKSEGAGADIGPNGEETVSSVPGITVEGGGALERLAPPVAIAPLDSLADLRGQGRVADEAGDSWAPAFLTALARARPGLRPPAVHRLTLSIGPEGANPAEKEAPADPAITRLADAALSGDAGAVARLMGRASQPGGGAAVLRTGETLAREGWNPAAAGVLSAVSDEAEHPFGQGLAWARTEDRAVALARAGGRRSAKIFEEAYNRARSSVWRWRLGGPRWRAPAPPPWT